MLSRIHGEVDDRRVLETAESDPQRVQANYALGALAQVESRQDDASSWFEACREFRTEDLEIDLAAWYLKQLE